MTCSRPGQDGRPSSPAARTPPLALAMLLALLPGGFACAPGDAASRDRPENLVATNPRALAPPAGRSSAIKGLAWGGSPGDRRLGALFDDGRFAIYRPATGPAPESVGLVVPDRGPLTSLAISATDRAMTGDASGLVLWDTSQAMARPIDYVDCGAVGTLAVEPIGPHDLLAGLEDGRLLRFRPDRDRIGEPRAEARSSGRASGVRALTFLDSGRSIVALREDGQGERRPRQLNGPPEPIGPALAVTEVRDRIIRILGTLEDGPALDAIARDGTPLWRFPLPAEGVDLAPVLGGDGLIVCCEDRILLMRPPRDGPPMPAEVRGIPAEGITRVAVDPADPAGGRVALADAGGRLVVYDAEDLARSAAPISLDNAADLAFRPQRRAYHTRPFSDRIVSESSSISTSQRLTDRIAEARRLLDRLDLDTLRPLVRDLEADPALDRDASAEIATLAAAVRQETGWPDQAIRHPLSLARETFTLRDRLDREADLRLWSGSLLVPTFDGRSEAGNAVRIEEALAEFRQAAALFRQADPSLERQARIAEAMTAWGLLALGRSQAAQTAFLPVDQYARQDPVLRQAPEFDRISAALAVARRDWEAADLASHRLLRRLTPIPDDRTALAREAALERVGNLAALGRWTEAALVLDSARPNDPEWMLRRATIRRRAGLETAALEPLSPHDSADGPESAAMTHTRGRFAVASESTRAEGVGLLTQAAETHRRAGRSDLALEADLERAEALERLNRPGEAIELFARSARTLVTESGQTRTRGAARPIGLATGRAYRGLARCQLALGKPEHALGALDQAALVAWFERSGEARVRSAVMVAPPGGATAPRLEAARRTTLDPNRESAADSETEALVRQLEVRRAAEHRELALTDPTRPFDLSSLRLADREAILVVAGIGPESLVGFLIRPAQPVLVQPLPIRRSDLRRAARLWRAALGDSGRPDELERAALPDGLLALAPEPDLSLPPAPKGLAPSSAPSPGSELSNAVVGPFLEFLGGTDRLVVVPDDALAALPLEGLLVGSSSRDFPSVCYAPSLSLLRRSRVEPREDDPAGGSILVASPGDPVLGLAVRSAYGVEATRVEVTTDSTTLSGRLVDGKRSPQILHLSTIALLDPATSRLGEAELVLRSGDSVTTETEMPRLSGSEILGLNLNGSLILLWLEHQPKPSVAEPTAWRDLAACWLAAGAEAVIVSLWDPPADSAPLFAAELHGGLSRNLAPAEALDRARRTLAARPATADPVHWAGYVLYQAGPADR
ncbi:CHAT domain-containing protein [Tautonia marina]|uniref:CHAT domain-containing protein n=1 Tax=Tautonia marina TaxID=2653855 RepID=UPI0012609D91|nr:CHAT domain-containing protein [Tautonia marina]